MIQSEESPINKLRFFIKNSLMRTIFTQSLITLLLILSLLLGFLDYGLTLKGQSELNRIKLCVSISCILKVAQMFLLMFRMKKHPSRGSITSLCLGIFYVIMLMDIILVLCNTQIYIQDIQQVQDLVCETILRSLQYMIFFKEMIENDRVEQKALLAPLQIMITASLYIIIMFTQDQKIIQRTCIFGLLVLFMIYAERDDVRKSRELNQITEKAHHVEEHMQLRNEIVQIENQMGIYTSSHKFRIENRNFGIKTTMQQVNDIIWEPDNEHSQNQVLDTIDTGLIIIDRNGNRIFQNNMIAEMERVGLIPENLLEVRVKKIDKRSMKLLKLLGGLNKSQNMYIKRSPAMYSLSMFQMSQASIQVFQNSPLNDKPKQLKTFMIDLINQPDRNSFRQPIICFETDPVLDGVSLTIKLVNGPNGQVYCSLQITDQLRRDTYLQRKSTFQVMRQLFMSFSHEFGTSLNYILALAQVAEQDDEIPFQIQDKFFTPIRKAGQMMQLKVSDMLDYNKILGKEFSLTLSQMNVTETINNMISMFKTTLHHKHLKLKVDTSQFDNQSSVTTDQTRLLQVLVNLVGNAQKFTYQGSITITLQEIYVKGVHYIKFIVEDTGVGMDENEQKGLNTLLNGGIRSTDKISNDSVGFGLGLLISNEITLQLSQLSQNEGGGINFQSQKGQGSKFWILVKNNFLHVSNEMIGQSNHIPLVQIDKKQVYDQVTSQIQNYHNLVHYTPRVTGQSIFDDDREVRPRQFMDLGLQRVKSIFPSLSGQDSLKPRQQSLDSVRSEVNQMEQRSKAFYLLSPKSTNPSKFNSSRVLKSRSPKSQGTGIRVVRLDSLPLDMKLSRSCRCRLIMIVDDEPINIFALEILLKKYNLLCDSATNGLDCVRKFKERMNNNCICGLKTYQLILMDLNMPIMDGLKATEAIRALDTKQPTICAVTAFVDLKSKQDSYSSGMNYFLNKPVQLVDLQKVLNYFKII